MVRSRDCALSAEGCEMAKMSAGDLKALLSAERYDALSAMAASKLSDERASALNYYMGNMSKDMPAPDGRSKAVSSDVADTIEGLMPPLMEIFAAGEEVVQFAPVGPEDVAAAEQETDYVNHVFMQQNPGFLVLYSFIKDALLSKVGVVKVWWECRQEVERETYLDQPDDAFALIVSQPGVEVVEHTEREIAIPRPEEGAAESAFTRVFDALRPVSKDGRALQPSSFETLPQLSLRSAGIAPQDEGLPRPKLHDVTIEIRRTRECARAEGVTPEEFGISRRARSIKDTDYCFHDVFRTEAQLIAQGYDREQVKKLPSYTLAHTIEEQARDTVNESTLRQGDDGLNTSSRLIRITEHYVRMDYEGNDEAALYRCTTAGEEGELLLRDGEPDVVREDVIPFAAMSHRHAPLFRPLDRRPGDGYPAHQNGFAAGATRQRLSRQQSPHRGAGESRHRDHARRSTGVAPGRDRAHQDAGRLERHRASRHRQPRVPVAAIPGRNARVAHWRVAAGAGRRSQRAAEPGRHHRQPDVQRQPGQGEADRPHLRRDRHPRPVRAPAHDDSQERFAGADRSAAQSVGHC